MANNLQVTDPPPAHKKGLIKIEDLYSDIELATKTNDYLKLVNSNPKKEWIKNHPQAQKEIIDNQGIKKLVPVVHIPVGIVEYLLTAIFQKWRVEVKSIQVIANSIVVTIRLWYLEPMTGIWEWQDGIGAAPIRVDKGAAATDFTKIQYSAVQTGAPAAESYALKDAAEKIGKLFGKDLNRTEHMDYQPTLDSLFKKDELPEELKIVISECTDTDALANLYTANSEFHHLKEFMQLITARKSEINGAK